jgi:hypothetical protein
MFQCRCQFCDSTKVNVVTIKSVVITTPILGEKDGILEFGEESSVTESETHYECAKCKRFAAQNEEELIKVLNEKLGIKLYILDEGNPETTIPILTDFPAYIRSDVGNSDHGGMDWEDYSRVCEKAEIKQIKKKKDLPANLLFAYPYTGGNVPPKFITCGELIKMMDKDGVISPEKLEEF